MFESDRGRPDPELRATRERSEPAVITIRTCFSYHPCRDGDGVSVSGEARVAGYHSEVIDFGEFTGQPPGYRGVGDVIQRMVREFGDDADLEIVIRPKSLGGTLMSPKQVQMRGIQIMSELMEDLRVGVAHAGVSAAESDSFAELLNRLFATIYPPGRGPYTSQELVRALSMRGMTLSAPYLSQLRTGERKRPSEQTIDLIAEFFGIRSEYFTDPDCGYRQRLDSDLGWLALAHDPDVRRLTTMLSDLDAETRERLMAEVGI